MKRTIHDDAMRKLKHNKSKGDKNISKKVGNNIVLVEEIGRGAMGAVYLGYDTTLKRWVAVKVLLREMFEDEKQFEYLKRLLIEEGRNLARVRHPGIIVVHDVDANYPALIMEYIDGVDFHTFLYDKQRKKKWGIPAFKKWFLHRMMEVADALRYAHSHGLIHKDFKPSNLMISRDEDGKWNKMTLIDFGLAQDNRKIKLTDGEIVLGTPSYMAPEQWSDLWEIDRRTDVFSFGILLYEILMEDDYHGAGIEIPQIQVNIKNSGFLQSKVGHLPIDQRTIFELCLAYERAQRAGGMLEVIGLLRGLQLALTHREKEFPGTSFPKPLEAKKVDAPISQVPKAKSGAAEKELENSLETPVPVQESKRFDATITGHLGFDGSVIPGSVPEEAAEPEGDSIELSMNQFEEIGNFDDVPLLPTDFEGKVASRSNWKLPIGIALVILIIGIPIVLYSLKEGDSSEKYVDPVEETLPQLPKLVKLTPKKSTPKVKALVKPKPMKPVAKKLPPKKLPPVVKVPAKPLPPKLGELPSLKYVVYLFNQEDVWCRANDKHRKKFDTSPLWRAWCLRKRVVKLYRRDKNNPEVAIALLDEVKARLCFYENLFRRKGRYKIKDPDLAKECKRIKNLIYKRFTYYLQGKRIHAVDCYLTARRSHRAKIRAEWKKKHEKSNP